jgi:hypothetical protein
MEQASRDLAPGERWCSDGAQVPQARSTLPRSRSERLRGGSTICGSLSVRKPRPRRGSGSRQDLDFEVVGREPPQGVQAEIRSDQGLREEALGDEPDIGGHGQLISDIDRERT